MVICVSNLRHRYNNAKANIERNSNERKNLQLLFKVNLQKYCINLLNASIGSNDLKLKEMHKIIFFLCFSKIIHRRNESERLRISSLLRQKTIVI